MLRRFLAGVRGAVRPGVLVTGGVAASAVVVVIAATSGGGPIDPGSANLWIDQSGGTCARQSTAGAYVDAASCGTIQAAYTAASCGDTVRIKGGSAYPAQSVDAALKDCSAQSNYVTFTPATGENVVLGGGGAAGEGEINMCHGMSWAKFLGNRSGSSSNFMLLDDGTQGSTSGFVFVSGGCGAGLNEWVHHIWVEGLSFEQYLIRGQDNITLKNNNIESGVGASDHYAETIFVTNGYNNGFFDNYTTNLVLDGNDIHGFTSELCRTGVAGGNNCHVECFTGEPENVTIINNRIWDCGNTAAIIFSQDAGFSTKGASNLVANNLIHDTENYPLQFGDMEAGSVVTVQSNTIRTGGGGGQATTDALGGSLLGTVNFTGNVLEGGNGISCGTLNGTWSYNVIPAGGSGCYTGGTGNQFSTSTNFTGAVPDFHLAASQTAQDLIPPGSCPTTTDLDGESRPKGTNCDAGADER